MAGRFRQEQNLVWENNTEILEMRALGIDPPFAYPGRERHTCEVQSTKQIGVPGDRVYFDGKLWTQSEPHSEPAAKGVFTYLEMSEFVSETEHLFLTTILVDEFDGAAVMRGRWKKPEKKKSVKGWFNNRRE